MERRYMVVKNGAKKDTGEAYTQAWRIKEGKDGAYSYLDDKDRHYIDGEIRPLGSVITFQLTEA